MCAVSFKDLKKGAEGFVADAVDEHKRIHAADAKATSEPAAKRKRLPVLEEPEELDF
jgi:hypothetical protein